MKVNDELLETLGCPKVAVKHDGKWVVATEFRRPKDDEIIYSTTAHCLLKSALSLYHCYAIFSPCTLPPKPDSETIKRLTPDGMVMTVSDEPDLESVPFIKIDGSGISFGLSEARIGSYKDFHGLRYGAKLNLVVKDPETRACENCGNDGIGYKYCTERPKFLGYRCNDWTRRPESKPESVKPESFDTVRLSVEMINAMAIEQLQRRVAALEGK